MKHRACLQLTQACNLRCKMCDFRKNSFESKDVTHFYKLIDIFAENGIKEIIFWGGEPFLNKDIYFLLEYAKKSGLITEVITNGTLIDKTQISKNIKNLDSIVFSIDSGISFVHEKIRKKKDIFPVILDNLEYITKLRDTVNDRLKVVIDVTLQKENFNNFDTIFELAEKYKTLINLDPVQLCGYGNKRDESLLLSEEQTQRLQKKLFDIYNEKMFYLENSFDSLRRIINYFKGYKIDDYCSALDFEIIVDVYGNVHKCRGNPEKRYNVFEYGGIKQEKLKMDQKCFGCGFSHVRKEDWLPGYALNEDLFPDYL